MTKDEMAQQLARLENQYEETAARLMVAEGLLSAVVRHLPEAAAAAVVDDFQVHQDYLEAASLNSSGATDTWIAKLQSAREIMLYRLNVGGAPGVPGSRP